MALNSVGAVFRAYEAELRRGQEAVEQQYMLSRGYADPPFGKLSAPMPPPPPASGTHKRNKRLLLCHP